MDKQIHIIWGNSWFSNHRINLLKKSGMKNIFVLDSKQNFIVRERNNVVYFSVELASVMRKDEPEKVHHLLMYVPPGKYKSKQKSKRIK